MEALEAPLPKSWREVTDEQGRAFYHNEARGESMWEHPLDGYYRGRIAEEKEALEKEALEERRRQKDGLGGGHEEAKAEFEDVGLTTETETDRDEPGVGGRQQPGLASISQWPSTGTTTVHPSSPAPIRTRAPWFYPLALDRAARHPGRPAGRDGARL